MNISQCSTSTTSMTVTQNQANTINNVTISLSNVPLKAINVFHYAFLYRPLLKSYLIENLRS